MLARMEDDTTLLDAGPRHTAAPRERLCVATRTLKPEAAQCRCVAGPAGRVGPHKKPTLPRRGPWVTAGRRDPAACA